MTTTTGTSAISGWRAFFLVACLYDVLLGLGFLLLGESILDALGMALPPHIAYIQLAAVFILIQGISYWFPFRDPLGNLGIVKVGIVYKLGYAGLALYYLAMGTLPSPFFLPWAVIDLGFLLGFVLFLRAAPRLSAPA